MIIRIVRMTFLETEVKNFLQVFSENKASILAFPGCHHVDLLQDVDHSNVYATYSHWEKEEDLEKYRSSELFKSVWGQTKVLFLDKPIAHSYRMTE
jgi:quinol monooxygenase YgiN